MSRTYRSKQAYIDSLRTVLAARADFKDLQYHRNPNTSEEYLILTDLIGHVFFFDVTGYSEANIFHCMAMIECGEKPTNFIHDQEKQFEIAKLIS